MTNRDGKKQAIHKNHYSNATLENDVLSNVVDECTEFTAIGARW